jgi:TctA family transporter
LLSILFYFRNGCCRLLVSSNLRRQVIFGLHGTLIGMSPFLIVSSKLLQLLPFLFLIRCFTSFIFNYIVDALHDTPRSLS